MQAGGQSSNSHLAIENMRLTDDDDLAPPQMPTKEGAGWRFETFFAKYH